MIKLSIMDKQKKSFQEVLQEIESPQDIGNGSWALPKNATNAEKIKYQLCQIILVYQQDNHLTDQQLIHKVNLTQGEIEDILYCRIAKVSLDNLVNSAGKLFFPSEIKVTVEKKLTKDYRATV